MNIHTCRCRMYICTIYTLQCFGENEIERGETEEREAAEIEWKEMGDRAEGNGI